MNAPRWWWPLLAALLVACAPGGRDGSAGPAPPELDAGSLRALLDAEPRPFLLDVRTPGEFAGGHIEGAVNVPVYELGRRLPEIAPRAGETVVVYCEVGPRARAAARRLRDAGFTDVRVYVPGMSEWRKLRS